MKKLAIYSFLVLLIALGVTSCSSSDRETPIAPVEDVTPIINTAKKGTWRVTFYSDHTDVETKHFEGYTFTFGNNDILTATNGTDTYSGIWNVSNDKNGLDDSPDSSIDFNITFLPELPINDFNDINDDWDVISYSDTKIELVDDKTDPKKVDYLTFEKN